MEKSETIGELAKALASAQGEIENAKKDSENPFFKSRYADLASVREACKKALTKNGLAVIQMPKTVISEEATIVHIETMLLHSSGEWVSGDMGAVPVKFDPQGLGSCITYLRRYALAAVTGVAAEDDDGNAASHGEPKKITQPKKTQVNQARKVLIQSVADAFKLLNQNGDVPAWTPKSADEYVALHFNGAAGVDELDDGQVSDLLKKLSDRLDSLKNGDTKRDNLVASIKTYFDSPEHLNNYLKEHGGKPIEQYTLAELETIEKDVGVPF